MADTAHIEEIINTEILPSLPAVAVKILSLCPYTGAANVARVISQDAALTARIIKAANIAEFAPAYPIAYIKRAIALLGNRQVLALSLAFSLVPHETAPLD